MDWASELGQIVDKYTQGGTVATAEDPHEDFEQVAQKAPQNVIASGLAQAFRSNQTPPFSEMVAKLFGNSDPNQRASLLNRLLTSIGPGAAAMLPGDLAGSAQTGNVSPEQANQVSPNQVQQIAAHAEQRNPTVIDEVSNFYAQHPNVVKAVGGMALSIALQHIVRRR